MKKISDWFNELTESLESDPEYIAESISIDLAMKINKKMEEQGVSQSELAKRLGVSKAYVSQILQGQNNMTVLTVCKLGSALNITPKIYFDDNLQTLETENIIPFQSVEAGEFGLATDNSIKTGCGGETYMIDAENTGNVTKISDITATA